MLKPKTTNLMSQNFYNDFKDPWLDAADSSGRAA